MIDVEQYIREELQWSPDADEWEKTLVISNLRTFAKHIEHALQQARQDVLGEIYKKSKEIRKELVDDSVPELHYSHFMDWLSKEKEQS